MKKYICLLLVICMCLTLMGCSSAAAIDTGGTDRPKAATGTGPADGAETADEEPAPEADTVVTLSDSGSKAEGGGVTVSGSTVTITAEGVYRITGSLSDGQLAVDAENAKVTLLLDGAQITCKGSAALYVSGADKVVVYLAEGSANSLTSLGAFTDPEGKIDAALFSKDDVTVKGAGSLTVTSENGHGVVSKDDLKIKGGALTVDAASKGLSGNDSVEISGGVVAVRSGKDAIHAENADDAEKGTVTISGGTVTLTAESDGVDAAGGFAMEGGNLTVSAGDDGVHTASALTVSGGSLTVASSKEGLEGKTIDISGGLVDITSKDDGVNATDSSASDGRGGMFAAQSGVYIRVSGGSLTVNAGGDGLDSNGDIDISGGTVYVDGPADEGNGALDYNGAGTVTGGTVVLSGVSGMALNFGGDSTQGSILYIFSSPQAAGTEITLTDSSGAVLARFTPSKSFRSVVVSAPGMIAGGTYTLACGDVSESITLSEVVWSNGGGMNGFGGGQGFGTPPDFDGSRGFGTPPDFDGGQGFGTPPDFDGKQGFGTPPGSDSRQSGAEGQIRVKKRSVPPEQSAL